MSDWVDLLRQQYAPDISEVPKKVLSFNDFPEIQIRVNQLKKISYESPKGSNGDWQLLFYRMDGSTNLMAARVNGETFNDQYFDLSNAFEKRVNIVEVTSNETTRSKKEIDDAIGVIQTYITIHSNSYSQEKVKPNAMLYWKDDMELMSTGLLIPPNGLLFPLCIDCQKDSKNTYLLTGLSN
ncbi:MAG: hypothetical protein GOV01_01840 [Candidatus Altiarchaeota archaeon]|nr:hypothetical protein [Candidatus Altiarchaeota archaeon]